MLIGVDNLYHVKQIRNITDPALRVIDIGDELSELSDFLVLNLIYEPTYDDIGQRIGREIRYRTNTDTIMMVDRNYLALSEARMQMEAQAVISAMTIGAEVELTPEIIEAATRGATIKLLSDGELWREGLRVPAGVAVMYQGQLYICQKTHIAKAEWPPDGTYDLWRKAGSIGIGEVWSETANYIEGDTVLFDGVLYIALRYSKGRVPSDSPEHWELKATEETYPQWADLPEGEPVLEGVRCWQDGVLWECIMQHIKSTVYKPKAGSSRWQEEQT